MRCPEQGPGACQMRDSKCGCPPQQHVAVHGCAWTFPSGPSGQSSSSAAWCGPVRHWYWQSVASRVFSVHLNCSQTAHHVPERVCSTRTWLLQIPLQGVALRLPMHCVVRASLMGTSGNLCGGASGCCGLVETLHDAHASWCVQVVSRVGLERAGEAAAPVYKHPGGAL